MQISTADFSVVIQGPIHGTPGQGNLLQLTMQSVQSVRRFLPGAEIIISTWIGSDLSHLDYDRVVLSEDPGAITYNDGVNKNKFNNNNRQIISTINGLRHATKKYSIKLRSDCCLVHSGFIQFLTCYPERRDYKFLSNRIVTSTVFSLNPRRIPVLFHVSDIFQVGLTSDLIDLWDIPLQPEPVTTRGGLKSTENSNDPYPIEQYSMKFASEQYIWYAYCKKHHFDLDLKYYSHISLKNIVRSELSIINNFVIHSPECLGLGLPEKMQKFIDYPYIYTHDEWHYLYRQYCVSFVSFWTLIVLVFETVSTSGRISFNFYKSYWKSIFSKI